MMTGTVNAYREALLGLVVQGSGGEVLELEAIIDTGFDGSLTLPAQMVEQLGFPFLQRTSALLGDGSRSIFDIYVGTVLWNGQSRRVPVHVSNTEPLLGMSLLYGSELTIQVVEGGEVRIRELTIV
jgi:clan AA aspartic protease